MMHTKRCTLVLASIIIMATCSAQSSLETADALDSKSIINIISSVARLALGSAAGHEELE